LDLLKSGVALKQETIYDILEILSSLKYEFTGQEEIKNKEALMFICKETGIVPNDPVEFVRYLIYTATGKTLLIKNEDTYKSIRVMNKDQKFYVNRAFEKTNEEQLAQVFNRFKPIFLTFKKVLEGSSAKTINRISRLSKTLHKPIPYNILNNIGNCSLDELKKQKKNLVNANFFQLARCLQYLEQSANADTKIYAIRNGKSYVQQKGNSINKISVHRKIDFLLDLIGSKYDLNGKKIYIPEGVNYALPTSEKMFVGNVPMGSKFVTDGPIAMGIYWENGGGAKDLDLSAVALTKIGWNVRYNYQQGNIMFSGDMTYADPCATEYIYGKKIDDDYLILNNVFSGNPIGSIFNIIIGKGDSINQKYMMDPNKIWFTAQTETIQRQSIVGLLTSEGDKNAAILVNLGSGASQVSGYGGRTDLYRRALVQRWKHCFYLNDLLEYCGAILVENEEDCEINLTPSKLEKDSILSLFKN
jgi:hypothetical protein